MKYNFSLMGVMLLASLLFQSCGQYTDSKLESLEIQKEQVIQDRKLDSIKNAEFAEACIGKTNYFYKYNGQAMQTEDQVKEEFLSQKNLYKGTELNFKPYIYHRVIRNDSIINYYRFSSVDGDTVQLPALKFRVYQDRMFLLLNKKLPDFKLEDMEGKVFSSSQLMGKPTLINFGGIYCRSCMAEIPGLNKFKKLYGDQINFICILDVAKKPVDLKNYFIDNRLEFYMLKNTQEYKELLGIRGLPYNVFLDKNGIVRDVHTSFTYDMGDAENNYFIKVADQLIKE